MMIMRGMVAVALAVVMVLAGGMPAGADVGPWVTLGSDRARPDTESQGLATVIRPSGSFIRYTGFATIPSGVRDRGWNHVGDPGSRNGFYIEPYQSDTNGAKLFRVEAPNGAWSEYTHRLASGEALNNSFVAISPGGAWMVSGEWGTMDRLLVYPTPGIAFTTPGADLPYAFAIRLSPAVTNVQGCEFVTSVQLLCSSDGPGKPLLQVDLATPLSGSDVAGRVTTLGQLPLSSACSGTFEVEGIDFDTRDGTLRVIVVSPGFCAAIDSKTWRFRHA
jgi:hypothetical protein